MKLFNYSVCFAVLIRCAFAPRWSQPSVDSSFFEGLEHLGFGETSDTASFPQAPRVAHTSPSLSSSATSAYRPPGTPLEAPFAPDYPQQQWGNVYPPSRFAPDHAQQRGNVHPSAPVAPSYPQQWPNVQPSIQVPQQWGHFHPSAPANPFDHVPGWNSLYQRNSAPQMSQQYAASTPEHLVPFDPNPVEPWHTVDDRNPDDLMAAVRANKGKNPVLETGGTSRNPWSAASWPPRPEEPPYAGMQPSAQEEVAPHWPPATAHNPSGIPGRDPLTLSGQHFAIKYEPDDGLGKMVDEVKAMLQISYKKPRDQTPRPILPHEVDEFASIMRNYLRRKRVFKELVFDGRRFLVSFLRQSQELELPQLHFSLSVWEINTDGSQTVMRCRGVFSVNYNYWKNVEGAEWANSYVFFSRNDVLMIEKGDARDLRTPEAMELWHGTKRSPTVASDTAIEATSFTYGREASMQPAFKDWLTGNLAKSRWKPESNPEVQLAGEEDLRNFSKSMDWAFARRTNVHSVYFDEQILLITFHRNRQSWHPKLSNYLAIWRHQPGGKGGSMVALGLYPMEKSQFDALVHQAKANELTFRKPKQ
ncbi:conserved hypothetical Ustilaginaceae-specific protein [Sporisorium reilianum SRZ2]|uniref:Conserved hypothetical Ustilaginaceae-specific protein n=1 Tax=Sporisorium reilianum (strain SRZ2) TaxID=999809 RepID=E7A3B5_SPORE|nr:conserved hypothetical Ustilaginaceae-specific protein [Sporisorium reilianum SRZ2]